MQKTKHVSIHVPNDFLIPSLYLEENPAISAMALKLGADAVSHIHKRAADAVRSETHTEAVRQVTEEFEAERKAAEASTTSTITRLRQEKTRSEEIARAAQLRVEALESSSAQQRAQLQREVRESLEELLASKDEQIHRLQQTLEKTMDGVGKRVESLQQSFTKTHASSKEKGAVGELIMENHLKRAFDCDVHIVSKGSETADIRMTRPDGAYLWEVKNYTRMVSNEEVNKFRRDLRLHPDVRGGILVSLREGIVGRARGGDIDLEFLEDGRFILFLSRFMGNEDPVFYLQTLRPFFEAIEASTKPIKEEAEAVRALEMKAALMTNLLRSHAVSITKHKNALVGHKKRTDSMFAEFSGYVLEAEAQLNTVLRVAMGGDEATATVMNESETYLSSIVFVKERLSDCTDDKTRDFVKWLLRIAEVREGTQVEIKDILERARKENYSEKWVRGLREELFQETAWPKGSRFIMGLRFIPEKLKPHRGSCHSIESAHNPL